MPFLGDMLVPWRVYKTKYHENRPNPWFFVVGKDWKYEDTTPKNQHFFFWKSMVGALVEAKDVPIFSLRLMCEVFWVHLFCVFFWLIVSYKKNKKAICNRVRGFNDVFNLEQIVAIKTLLWMDDVDIVLIYCWSYFATCRCCFESIGMMTW